MNKLEEDIKILENMNDGYTFKDCDICNNYNEKAKHCDKHKCMELQAIEHILSDYKRVLKENKQLRTEVNSLKEENEELNKNYNSLIDKIILKIDEYDYKFEKAKRQNKNDIADYYWDLIRNFKQLLGGSKL